MSGDTSEALDLSAVRLMRVFTDPVVFPQCGSGGTGTDAYFHDAIIPRRLALLVEAGDERVDVATWPEAALCFSSVTLAVPPSRDGMKMYGYAFARLLEQQNISNADRVLESVSNIVPEDLSERLLDDLTEIRRDIKCRQDERFLEEVYHTLNTDVPKSFWKNNGSVTGHPPTK